MSKSPHINRKAFIELSLGMSASAWLIACGQADPESPVTLGSGGAGGSAGAPATGGAGVGAAGGVGGGAGTGGAATGGAGHANAGAAGAPAGSAGTVSGAGGSTAGSTGRGGSPGAGAGGQGAVGSGGVATGGAGAGGRPSGGAGAGVGGRGSGGSGGGGMCGTLTIVQNPGGKERHDHIPDDAPTAAEYYQLLMDHINGPTPTMSFTVFAEGTPSHTHELLFTQAEIDTLRAGGKLTAKDVVPDATKESHIYTIGCTA